MSVRWRLLVDPPATGARNMAVDESLLLHADANGPSIRLYAWEHPTVSLGYRQPEDPWARRARDLGVDVVRRVTGGGAVLHDADLTYAVVAPADCDDVPPDLHGSYLWIRAVLLAGLRAVGLPAESARGRPGADRLPVCFAGSVGVEIELERTKLVGSAQRRLPTAFLQHGSIRLHDAAALHEEIFGAPIPSPPAGLSVPSRARIVDCLCRAFASALDGRLQTATLTSEEESTAHSRQQVRRSLPLRAPSVFSRRAPRVADTLA